MCSVNLNSHYLFCSSERRKFFQEMDNRLKEFGNLFERLMVPSNFFQVIMPLGTKCSLISLYIVFLLYPRDSRFLTACSNDRSLWPGNFPLFLMKSSKIARVISRYFCCFGNIIFSIESNDIFVEVSR